MPSTLAAFGALPEPFKANGFVDPAGLYKAKQSPPIPVIAGSTTHRVAQAAIAASAAFPPAFKISIPTWLANGWLVAIIAFEAITGERPGR
jgi:hypothetical protein